MTDDTFQQANLSEHEAETVCNYLEGEDGCHDAHVVVTPDGRAVHAAYILGGLRGTVEIHDLSGGLKDAIDPHGVLNANR